MQPNPGFLGGRKIETTSKISCCGQNASQGTSREHHKDSIVQAALRRTAGQLLAQPLQVSHADRQLFKAIEHYNEAREKRREAREKRRTVKSEITPRGVK